MEEVRRISEHFDAITCQRIFREANTEADLLSKQALGPFDGHLRFCEMLNGAVVDQGNLITFWLLL